LITRARRAAHARLAACATLACAALLVTACGSSASSSAAGQGPSPSHAGTASASTAASASTSAGPADPVTPGVAGTWLGYGPCPDIGVTLGISEHDPAVTYQVIDFTNRGSTACVLSGYPGVSLGAGHPAVPIGLPAGHTGFKIPAGTLTLRPGGVANATLEIADAHSYAQAKCAPVQARYLIVYRPNLASPVTLAFTATACAQAVRLMQVSAVSPGTGG
jgi:Protein of unknown function (DUF4232)